MLAVVASMRPVIPALLLAAATLLAAIAPASAGGPPGSVATGPEAGGYDYGFAERPQTRTKHYGTTILLADVAWIAVTTLAANREANSDGESSLSSVLALGYFVAGPAVHLKYGNSTGASKSLAARALLPVGGALIGIAAMSGKCRDDSFECGLEPLVGMFIGGGLGMLGAMALDWTLLGKTEVEVPGARQLARLQPRVNVSKHGASVALGGAF